MDIHTILAHRPKLTDGPLVTPQPSLEEIVREHYARLAGAEQGATLANAYLDRLTRTVEVAGGTMRSEPYTAPRPTTDTGRPSMPDRTAARGLVLALVRHATTQQGPVRIETLRRLLDQWRTDPRLTAIHPALVLTDAEGGLSAHVESPLSLRSVLRSLVNDDLVSFSDGLYSSVDRTAATEDAPSAAPHAHDEPDPTPKGTTRDPMDGMREVLKEVGLDVRVGDVDLTAGMRRVSEGGSALPLLTGLAGVFLGAVAGAESRRRKD